MERERRDKSKWVKGETKEEWKEKGEMNVEVGEKKGEIKCTVSIQ